MATWQRSRRITGTRDVSVGASEKPTAETSEEATWRRRAEQAQRVDDRRRQKRSGKKKRCGSPVAKVAATVPVFVRRDGEWCVMGLPSMVKEGQSCEVRLKDGQMSRVVVGNILETRRKFVLASVVRDDRYR